MKRLALFLLFIPLAAGADQTLLRAYGVATTVDVCLADYDTPTDFEVAATFAVGDVTVMKDDGAPVDIGTLPTDEGQCYSVPLTGAEMTAARITVTLVDQDATKVWMDTALYIETFGNALAAHPGLGRLAFWQYVLDDGITAEQAACYMLSVLAGQANFTPGVPGQSVFEDPSGVDARVTVTYGDDNGDRTDVVLNAVNCGSN